MTGEAPVIPDGYAAYGWHHYGTVSGIWYGSRVHLVPDTQIVPDPDRAFGPAVCGAQKPLTRRRSQPSGVVRDMERGERQPCARCFKKASPDDA
jgi:hypothetical protein